MDFDSWTYGGCRLLVVALAEVLPARFATYRFRKLAIYHHQIPQHVAFSAINLRTRREYIVDGTGATTTGFFIKKFREASYPRVQHPSLNLHNRDYLAAELEKYEIICPAVKLQKLVQLIKIDRSGLFDERINQ